jgi:hypothetical protein
VFASEKNQDYVLWNIITCSVTDKEFFMGFMDILFVIGAFLLFITPVVLIIVVALWLQRRINKKKDLEFEKYSHTHKGQYKHVEGLPFASGVMIDVYYGNGKFTFCKDKQEVVLSCDKVVSLDTCFGKDVNNQVATGAIAGGLLIGGLGGAALGALAASTLYFIVTYKKDKEPKFIMLDIAYSGNLSEKIIKDFKKSHTRETEVIEL